MATVNKYSFNWKAPVPFALDDDGRRIHPELCDDKHKRYRCPFCRGMVAHVEKRARQTSLVSGEAPIRRKSRPFWRHSQATCANPHGWLEWRRSQPGGGGGESELHEAAKRRIAHWLADRREEVEIQLRCAGGCETLLTELSLPEFDRVVTEHTLASGHRLDVALLDERGRVVLAVEVRYSHEIDAGKRAALVMPWIEVDVFTVRDCKLHAHNSDRGDHYCPDCAADLEKGRCWWREYSYSPAIEQYIDHELRRRLAQLARVEPLSDPVIRRLSAQLCQTCEDRDGWAQRSRRGRDLAATQGLALPDGVRPQVWYCRACCRSMVVCYWADRERGAEPPGELLGLLRRMEERWNEVCECGAVQDIHWRWPERRQPERALRRCSVGDGHPFSAAWP